MEMAMKTWLAGLLCLGELVGSLRPAEPFFVDLSPVVNTALENNGQEGWSNLRLITSAEPAKLEAQKWLEFNRGGFGGIENGLHQRLDVSHNDDRVGAGTKGDCPGEQNETQYPTAL
jgi:hypothetical protein